MTDAPTLAPEALQWDAEGRPCSARYGDLYASRDGALGQARHVFLGGNDLPRAWAGRRHYTIVETGFGLGGNFLATWDAWRADPARPRRLHYYSVEKHPLSRADLLAAAGRATPADDAPIEALRRQLVQRWPAPIRGLHRLDFEAGAVALTLVLGDAQQMIPQLQLGADAFYLDGFAPDRNPQMWTPQLLKALARLARPGASCATYTSARAVRETLAANGFECELVPGFGHKREMLRGRYAPRWKMRRHEPPAPHDGPQQALVVGAGLAGCACAAALVARGWQVRLVDRGGVGAAASALPGGLLVPLLSADDNLASRLVRAGYRYSLAALRELPEPAHRAGAAAPVWAPCGVFEQAQDARHEAHLRAVLQAQDWPPSFAQYCTGAAAAARLGRAPQRGGVWFADAGVVSAARWCAAMTQPVQAGADDGGAARLQLEIGFEVVAIERAAGGWAVRDGQGRVLRAPVLVLANAGGLAALHELPGAALQSIGGRLSLLRPPAFSDLPCAIGGDGYVIPPLLGPAAVGATYDFVASAGGHASGPPADGQVEALAAAHRSNLARLQRLFAQAPQVDVAGVFAAQRCVAPDRLPLAGPLLDEPAVARGAEELRGARLRDLPRLPGLYGVAALGSRGLSLAPLLAEHVAASICGEPAPLEAALAAAIDPGRFALRRLR